jgi:hypothetical protein
VWMRLDQNRPPARLRHRLALRRDTVGSAEQVLEGAAVAVAPRAVSITPPFHGEWVAVNGPSNTSGHRRLGMALNGVVASGQRFGIDYLKIDSAGRSYVGDRLKNSSYYAYGTPLLAVGDGIVVAIKDSIPENIPGGRAVPINLETVGGNHVVIDLGDNQFAFYAHMQPGTIRVRVGDRVKRGLVIGLLGNSGNSTEPHLHFHVSDSPATGTSTLGSEGIPYAFPSFEVIGRCSLTTSIACTRHAPVTVRNGLPMQNQLVRLP